MGTVSARKGAVPPPTVGVVGWVGTDQGEARVFRGASCCLVAPPPLHRWSSWAIQGFPPPPGACCPTNSPQDRLICQSWAHPRPGAGQQGELTDAACEPPVHCPLPWARECPCRPSSRRISGACSSGVRSQPRQKAVMPGWGTTLPSTHTGAAPGEPQRLQVTPESIQEHWGHVSRLGAWRVRPGQRCCVPAPRPCGFLFA